MGWRWLWTTSDREVTRTNSNRVKVVEIIFQLGSGNFPVINSSVYVVDAREVFSKHRWVTFFDEIKPET